MTVELQGAVPNSHHAVIILAAGLSTRLGTPKQLLCKHGQPLIEVMTKEALKTNPAAVIIVSQNQSKNLADVLTSLSKLSNRNYIVINRAPEKGMAQSLSLGVEALKTLASSADIKRVLILGIDQIHLDSAHLQELLTVKKVVGASSYPKDEAALINADDPRANIVGLPIAIDYAKLTPWQDKLSGDKGLRALIRSLDACQIATVINPKLCYDIDTKAQLEAAQSKGWLDQ
ncbi:nucleotidyltransferase family protein [Psychrobacter ciconiae]|uniref:nucleotidyltransferase family protein n=1 Tax=Psychrobacter ciconiae TaxID=1553449 RepID=UPI001917F352|nr:nucleotidyltransferase family protein [Psychrobacter ciconiae]